MKDFWFLGMVWGCLWLGLPGIGFTADQEIVINEILYNPPQECTRYEFIELYNRGKESVDLGGWFLMSAIRFTFPENTILVSDGYLIVTLDVEGFKNAFPENRAPVLGPYDGRLNNNGEPIVLLNQNKEEIDRVEYSNLSPWPARADGLGSSLELINPFLDNQKADYWRASLQTEMDWKVPENRFENITNTATPGRRNSVYNEVAPPVIYEVAHNPERPKSGEDIVITAKVKDESGIGIVTLSYQIVPPGQYIRLSDTTYQSSWTAVEMRDDGLFPDTKASDAVFTARIPAQTHRTLVRYRVTAKNGKGAETQAPNISEPSPNFACFVYDGVPPYQVTKPVERVHTVLEKVPVYHLIALGQDIRDCEEIEINGRKERRDYKWYGTFVFDDTVYDHIRFRLRGGVWRYSFNKCMWKIHFNKGQYLQGRYNFGLPNPELRSTIDLGSLSQNMMVTVPHRGELGFYEGTAFWLFQKAGVLSSDTTWIHFRIIDDASEAGRDQFIGDFYGLFLEIESPDERMLRNHGYNPNSNLYKINNGWTVDGKVWEKESNSCNPTDDADIQEFYNGYRRKGIQFLEQQLDLTKYLSYRCILEAVHHYDVYAEKNYYYFHNADTDLWEVTPWDLDLTFGSDHGNGKEPFRDMVVGDFSSRTPREGKYATPFRNRLREIIQLLYNENVLFPILDRRHDLIAEIAAADLDRWDLFQPPDAAASKSRYKPLDFRLQEMKDWIIQRIHTTYNDRGNDGSHYIMALEKMAEDTSIPNTPVIAFPNTNANLSQKKVTLTASPFSDPENDFHVASRWIITEDGRLEVEPNWDSGETQECRTQIPLDLKLLPPEKKYRVRVKYQDSTGRWSFWSEPVEFMVEKDTAVDGWRNH